MGNKIFHRYVENGKRYNEVVEEFPYELFIENPVGDSFSLFGKPLMRIPFKSINEMSEWIKQQGRHVAIHGNTSAIHQFIAKTYPGELRPDNSYVVLNFDCEMEHADGFPEPAFANQEIISISAEILGENSINYTFGTKSFKFEDHEKDVVYIQCDNEKDLLIRFLQYWKENYPDFVTGWNTESFDIVYLINRMKKIIGEKLTKQLSPFWKETGRVFQEFKISDEETGYHILGITSLDYMLLYKKFNPTKQESYRLDHIGEVELGENKVDYSEYGNLMDLYNGEVSGQIEKMQYDDLTEIQKFELAKRKIKRRMEELRNI